MHIANQCERTAVFHIIRDAVEDSTDSKIRAYAALYNGNGRMFLVEAENRMTVFSTPTSENNHIVDAAIAYAWTIYENNKRAFAGVL
jgi:hypothetical protein